MKPSDWAISALTTLYKQVVQLRSKLYDQKLLKSYTSSIPVVSVGNITVGGNGKTPLCLFLVEQLARRGYRPVVLSRGYGGSARGPYPVKPDDPPSLVGDEPLLIARSSGVPVIVARRRAEGAKLIERNDFGNVIILDDGFQHRALARNVDIVSIFAGTTESVERFVEGRLLPRGRFREDRSTALARADVVVIAERKIVPSLDQLKPIDPRLLNLIPPTARVYRSYLEGSQIVQIDGHRELRPQPIVAFAGLAQPEGFFESLEQLGFTLLARRPFADHHPFSVHDLLQLRDEFPDSPLVCTEKDAVKIQRLIFSEPLEWYVFKTELTVIPRDAFMVQIVRALRDRVAKV